MDKTQEKFNLTLVEARVRVMFTNQISKYDDTY